MAEPGQFAQRTRAPHDDRGSALMLVPAAILLVIILAAVAVDSAGIFLSHRGIRNLADAAANDAATLAIDTDHYRATNEIEIDPVLAEAHIEARISTSELADQITAVEVRIVDQSIVEVRIVAATEPIFAPATPGSGDGRATVEVVGRAEAVLQ